MKRQLLLAVLLAASALQGVRCPIDNSSAYLTGKTKADVSGKLIREYKCTRGHLFWVVFSVDRSPTKSTTR